MFLDYLRERDGVEAVEFEGGFYTFLVRLPQFYISDFYIAKTHRGQPKFVASMLSDIEERARSVGCIYITCHVGLSNKNLDAVVQSRLKWGFKITGVDGENLSLVKRVEE